MVIIIHSTRPCSSPGLTDTARPIGSKSLMPGYCPTLSPSALPSTVQAARELREDCLSAASSAAPVLVVPRAVDRRRLADDSDAGCHFYSALHASPFGSPTSGAQCRKRIVFASFLFGHAKRKEVAQQRAKTTPSASARKSLSSGGQVMATLLNRG